MLVVGGGSLYTAQPLKQLGKLTLMRYNHTVWNYLETGGRQLWLMINSAQRGLVSHPWGLLILCETPVSGVHIAPTVKSCWGGLEERKEDSCEEDSCEAFCLGSSFPPQSIVLCWGEIHVRTLELGHPLTAQTRANPFQQTETSYWNSIRLCATDPPSVEISCRGGR